MQTGTGDEVLKEPEREKLAADVADYLRKGGKIEEVDVTWKSKQDFDKRSPIGFDEE